MNDNAIIVENLSKCYRIGLKERMHDTLTSAVFSWIRSPFNNLKNLRKLSHFNQGEDSDDMIWALRDISFQVKKGEVIGIIGSNGAGKSTLLKILSHITEPSSGRAVIDGRVSSLLEVGTGFHPELSGRENIYLNGTILGMTKKEIDSKFDDIVDFSGVEKFIDTPIKRYSSGMKVRLAFSVAAHLEPEILLIDEVLAVGDIEFQKKCLGKMSSVAEEGRTVLFVSHNMSAVNRICDRGILLKNGEIILDDASGKAVSHYISMGMGATAHRQWNLNDAPGNDFVRINSIKIIDENNRAVENIDVRNKVGIEIVFTILQKKTAFVPNISLYSEQGIHILNAIDTDDFWDQPLEKGIYKSISWLPNNFFNEGTIFVTVALNTLSHKTAIRQAVVNECVSFTIFDLIQGDTAKGKFNRHWGGAVSPLLEWSVELL